MTDGPLDPDYQEVSEEELLEDISKVSETEQTEGLDE